MDRDSNGRYLKGGVPHNKGKRMEEYIKPESIERIKSSQFKAGNVPANAREKGFVRKRNHYKRGELVGIDWFINIDWHGNRHPSYGYRKYLWEVANQQDAPKGMVFVAKDGDYTAEPTLDNVEMISRIELLKRNNPRI